MNTFFVDVKVIKYIFTLPWHSQGSRKKITVFFSGPATKRGGGKGLATKKKGRFLQLPYAEDKLGN